MPLPLPHFPDIERLQFALEAGKIGIWECNHQLQMIRWSHTVAKMVGLREDQLEVSYEEFFAIVHPDDLPSVQQALLNTFETHEEFLVEYRVIWPDGTEHWIEDRGSVVVPEDGSPPSTIRGVVVDIDSRKRKERTRLLDARLNRAARYSALGEITAGMAHELNQPLTAIVSSAEILTQTRAVEEHVRSTAIELMCESAFRASNIVARLRSLVRKAGLMPALVCPNQLISDTREIVEFALMQGQTKLRFQLDRKVPQMNLDSIQIHQVLVNLINNSIEAMQGIPAAQRTVRISTDLIYDRLRVTVTDSGPGVSVEDPAKLFEHFSSGNSKGLGIGLPICKSIIESHDGTIWLESSSDAGATFCFEIPVEGVMDGHNTDPSD
ncbi:MAG: PAS domain-containing sensor histidine kinase [Planctomycetota bacterium]